MTEPVKSRRGVYRDLSMSPYEYVSPYGDTFKFSSAKKLEIYTRDIEKELNRLSKALDRLSLGEYVPAEIIQLLYRMTFRSFYRNVEG